MKNTVFNPIFKRVKTKYYMPAKVVTSDTLIKRETDRTILDVRSPGEYSKAHMPGAYNLPLFTDIERSVVGTTYKQESPEKAMLLGLEFAGQKMRSYVEQAVLASNNKKVLLYCWRGGKRSESMGWLLAMAGLDVQILKGGYKAYRNLAHVCFNNKQIKFIVLGGPTGSGKTEILQRLELEGEQIVDLEKLSSHKGSAFGSLGEKPQPTTEHFENLLFECLQHLDTNKRIFIENESNMIGKCQIPLTLFNQMKQFYYIQCLVPYEERLATLVRNYAHYPQDELKERFEKIRKKLGGDQLKAALQFLDENRYRDAAEVAMKFYDKTYAYGYEKNTTPHKLALHFDHSDPGQIAHEIIQTCNKLKI